MKKGANVITVYFDEHGEAEGLRGKLCRKLATDMKIETLDSRVILNEKNQPVGGFYYVSGAKLLVDFLSWLTDISFGNPFKRKNRCYLGTKDGKISEVVNLDN